MPVRFPHGVDDAGNPVFVNYWNVTEAAPMLHVTRETFRTKCASEEWPRLAVGSASRTRYFVNAEQLATIVQLLTAGPEPCGELDDSPVQLGTIVPIQDDEDGVQ